MGCGTFGIYGRPVVCPIDPGIGADILHHQSRLWQLKRSRGPSSLKSVSPLVVKSACPAIWKGGGRFFCCIEATFLDRVFIVIFMGFMISLFHHENTKVGMRSAGACAAWARNFYFIRVFVISCLVINYSRISAEGGSALGFFGGGYG